MLESQLDFIRFLQHSLGTGPLWESFFEGLSFLGDEQFYLLALPLLFWSVDFRLGVQVSYLYILSSALNIGFKQLFMQPRPGDLDPAIELIEPPAGGGLPSGHAQTGVIVWGYLASRLRRGWGWGAAGGVALLIGLSRVYLGLHFPTDVLGGWVIGIWLLIGWLGLGRELERSIRELGLRVQLLLSLLVPALVLLLQPAAETAAAMGAVSGVSVGIALNAERLHYQAAGTIGRRALRYLLGGIVLVGMFYGLRSLFPAEGEPLYIALRHLRYAAVGLWVTYAAPWLFARIGLASAGERATQQPS